MAKNVYGRIVLQISSCFHPSVDTQSFHCNSFFF